MTSGAVTFNAAAFVVRYPNFAAYNTANPGGLQMFFDEATLLLNNTFNSIVRDVTERTVLLNMLVAHIGTMAGILAPQGAGSTAGQVGRVSDASEGTVRAALDMGVTPGTAAWYQQTQYGATYWTMTAKYRTMRYIAPRCWGR